MPNGQKVNVVLKGQDLHENPLQPKTAMKHNVSTPQTAIQEHPALRKTTDTLRFTGSAASHGWEYTGFSSGQEGSAVPIGPLGVNLESDYVEDPSFLSLERQKGASILVSMDLCRRIVSAY